MKRILSIVCVLAMVLSLCNVAAFASETEVITITNADEFYANVTKDTTVYKTYVIEGNEVLGKDINGNDIKGIDLTTYSTNKTITKFYGEIKGKDGHNGIKLKGTSLISTVGDGPAKFENLILVGDPKTPGDNSGALFNQALEAATSGGAITVNKVINYVDITASRSSAISAGGLVGNSSKSRTISFENCINYGDITNNAPAGSSHGTAGIIGNVAGGALNITNCHNYGNIKSKGKVAGILGNRTTIGNNDWITNCSNHGEINCEADTGSNYAAAGIACSYFRIQNSYNAGNVTSTQIAGGIFGGLATATDAAGAKNYSIINCFNIGTVESKDTATYYAGGITGGYSNTNCVVENCYNAGEVKGGKTTYPIGYSKSNGSSQWANNYRVDYEDESESPLKGKPITKENLAELPAPFNAEPWEKNEDGTFYSLPQIINNTFYADENDGWYIEGTPEPDEPVDPEPEDPEEPEEPVADYEINTAEEFKNAVLNDSSIEWTIKGTDDLGEGRHGIDLTKAGIDYASKTDFAGILKGIDGANYIKVDKALFDSFKSKSTAIIENIILIGDITAANTYNGVLVNSTRQSGGTYEIRNVINKANLTATAGTAGGFVGYSINSDIAFENCANYGNITSAAEYAAGIIPLIRNIKLTVKSCENYGTIEGQKQAAGLAAYVHTAGSYNIEKCANYGNVISGVNNGAVGIAGVMKDGYVKESFNAGEIVSVGRAASGIASISGVEGCTVEISDCYNAGVVRSGAHNTEFRPSGIASVTTVAGTIVVSNCYNVGEIYAVSAATGNNVAGYPIVDSAKADVTNCYYTNTDVATGTKVSAGTYKLRHRFARVMDASEPLPEGLNRENTPWVYLEKTEDNVYTYPQLKDNQFKTTSKTYEVLEPQVSMDGVSAFTTLSGMIAERLSDSFSGLTGNFAVTGAKFTLANATKDELEYGMLFSKSVSEEELTVDNCDSKAKSTNSVSSDNQCSYGILFHGALKAGETYSIRPYLIFDDVVQYGETSTFTINSGI